jgi:hypothetical protein
MLRNHTSAFDEHNLSIPHARRIVREQIGTLSQMGRLQEAALDQKAVGAHLAVGPLSSYVIGGVIKVAMIERWVMEAISNQAQHGQEGR